MLRFKQTRSVTDYEVWEVLSGEGSERGVQQGFIRFRPHLNCYIFAPSNGAIFTQLDLDTLFSFLFKQNCKPLPPTNQELLFKD